MDKVVTAYEALAQIKDGDTIAVLGSGGGICEPTLLLQKLGEKFQSEGSPRNLTFVHANGLGDKKTTGADAVALSGLVKRDIAGHWAMAPKMAQLALDNQIEAYNLPQGVLSQMYQMIASGKPGVITKTGLYTYIDPRLEGGRMNAVTTEELVQVIELAGEEWLFYPSIKLNVAFVRGTTADLNGNISYEEEPALLDGLALAQAVKNSGGVVIAQVKYLVNNGTIPAKQVVIPGIYVDYIVVDPTQPQTCERSYDPMLTGNLHAPVEQLPPMALDARKVVARRAAKELPRKPGSVINLGVGMPAGIASIAAEEGYLNELNFTVEQGIIGGMPMDGIIFGVSYCPDAIISQTAQFDFYDGGGLDAAFLGMAQVDRAGNVNSSKTGALLSGCGGAINISQNAKKVVFCGTFNTKGFRAQIGAGRLAIEHEGAIRKLVETVDQVTFSGKYALEIGQPVLYITERAVFALTADGLRLTEIAPGLDLQRDVLDQMSFVPLVSDALKTMDADIFS